MRRFSGTWWRRKIAAFLAFRLLVACLVAAPVQLAHAYTGVTSTPANANFSSFMEGLMNYKASINGTFTAAESAAMPAALDGATTSLVDGAIAAAPAVAAGTPIGWIALAGAGVVAAGAAGYCMTVSSNGCGLSWLNANNGNVSQPGPNGPDITAGQPEYTGSGCVTGYATTAADYMAECVAYLNTSASTGPQFRPYQLGGGTPSGAGKYTVSGTCNASGVSGGSCTQGQTSTLTVQVTTQTASNSCPGGSFATNVAACTGVLYPPMPPVTGDPITEGDQVPLQYGSAVLSPNTISDVANDEWRAAASQQGYAGLIYSSNAPITPADVTNYEQTLPQSVPLPTMKDYVAPIANPGTVAASSTSSAPSFVGSPNFAPPSSSPDESSGSTGQSPTGAPYTSSSSSSPSSSLPPCGNKSAGEPACEVDWNPDNSALPADPAGNDYTDILKSLLTLSGLAFWKSWQVSLPPGSCTNNTIRVPVINQTFTLDLCTPLSTWQPTVSTIETALMAIATVVIILSA